MSLSEDKSSKEAYLTIERFEEALRRLLVSYADYQKQIIGLTEENKRLRDLLEASTRGPSTTTKNNLVSLDKDLTDQINKYIKEIDRCLAYFEQA